MPRPPTARARWHARTGAVVLAWLAAAVVALAFHDALDTSRWLIVHLLLLGAATNAIVVWTAHFTVTLLRSPPGHSRTVEASRLVALNVALVGVIVGVENAWRGLTVAAAAVLTAVAFAHVTALVVAVRRRARDRFTAAVRFYWASGVALVAGVAAGVALVVGVPAAWYPQVYAAHVLLNVLGWIALTVLGTELTMWPMVLRTRMADTIDASARLALPVCAAGLAIAVGGALASSRITTSIGLLLYVVGIGVSLDPFVRTAWQRPPRTAAAWMLAAATAWLCAGVVAVLAVTLDDGGSAELTARLHAVVPWLVPGFVAQVVMGALTYLLPVVLGGGPTGGRQITVLLERWWQARVIVFNTGVVLVAVAAGGVSTQIGWWVVGVGVGSFVVLAVAGIFVSGAGVRRRSADPRNG